VQKRKQLDAGSERKPWRRLHRSARREGHFFDFHQTEQVDGKASESKTLERRTSTSSHNAGIIWGSTYGNEDDKCPKGEIIKDGEKGLGKGQRIQSVSALGRGTKHQHLLSTEGLAVNRRKKTKDSRGRTVSTLLAELEEVVGTPLVSQGRQVMSTRG